jgi:hypothetical protein
MPRRCEGDKGFAICALAMFINNGPTFGKNSL